MTEKENNSGVLSEAGASAAALTAETLLAMLEIIGSDTKAMVLMAQEAVERSVIPECSYEHALALYMNVLGVAGKVERMLSVMTPEVLGVLARQALAQRERSNATCH